MQMSSMLKYQWCILLVGVFFTVTDALKCYQCNIFVRGSPWPCDSERGMKVVEDCVSCLKTYTRSELHNTFHDSVLTSYESRVCMKDKDYAKSDGCHAQETDGGYMKRCFCYTDLCNSVPSRTAPYWVFGASVFAATWIARRLTN